MQNFSAYSNFLVDVTRLVYIVGQTQATSLFKKQFDIVQTRTKLNYKLINELPPNIYKKNKPISARKGIIKVDWIDKIIDKAPQMIILVFNSSQDLAQNEKWEDRLGIIIRKINKVYEILKATNKEEIIMKIVIIISKYNAQGIGINIVDKIKDFLSTYQRDLHIIQLELFTKQTPKIKLPWITQLERNYDRKYRNIQKRMEQSFTERRLGCMVKIAILAQLLNRRDDLERYQEAYTSVKFRFGDLCRNSIDSIKYQQIRELRTVGDVLLLRMLKIKLSTNKKIDQQISNHLNFFKIGGSMNPRAENPYFYYEELIWRSSFIENLLEVIHLFQENQPLAKLNFAELINGVLTYLYYICQINESMLKTIPRGKQLETGPAQYLGFTNFLNNNDVTDQNIVFTKMREIFLKRKDFIAKGIQLITRCKGMKVFGQNQLTFLNTYLLRFYLTDGKFEALVPIYNQVIKMEMKRSNYFLLNELLKEISVQLPNIQDQNKVVFYSVAILICDYFHKSQELEKFLNYLVDCLKKSEPSPKINSFENDPFGMGNAMQQACRPLDLYLKKNSNIFKVEVFITERFKAIEEPIVITIKPTIHQAFKNLNPLLQVNFTHQSMKFENLSVTQDQIQLKINALDYLKYDETIQIKNMVLYTADRRIVWKLGNQQLIFKKYQTIFVYTPIKIPDIEIICPYDSYYLNETVPLDIKVSQIEGCQVQAKFSAKEENKEGKTEIFVHLEQKINLTNSKLTHYLKVGGQNVVYMKLNKIGEKKVQFHFHITVKKVCKQTQKGTQNILTNSFSITKEIYFKVNKLFDIIKTYKQTPSGDDLKANEIPINKKIALHFKIQAADNISIVQLSQHKNSKFLKYYKQIMIKDVILTAEEKLKCLLIFQLVDTMGEKQFFLAKFYIKWKRLNLKREIENLYVDDDIKLKLSQDMNLKVDFSAKEELRSKFKSSVVLTITNLQNKNIDVYAIVETTQYLLRIGEKGKTIKLRPAECKEIQFDVLPIKAGFWKFPSTKVYANGLFVKSNSQGNIIFIS